MYMCVLCVNLYDFPIGAVPADSVVFLFCFSLYIYMMSNVLLLVAIPGDPKAQQPTLAQGKSMALTCIDLYKDSGILKEIKEEFAEFIQKSQ